MEVSQQDQTNTLPHLISQANAALASAQDRDRNFFTFLKADEERPPNSSSSFFSENGLCQDIIKLTGAEPDICLEAFYALYHTLRPQIENHSDYSFKDAWKKFIGGSVFKGTLCPPEKLIIERKVRNIKRSMSEAGGEAGIFHDLDGVVDSIFNLKQKINDYSGEILYKKEVIESLSLVQEFYLSHRNKVQGLVRAILEKEKLNVPHTSESEALEDLLEPKAIMTSDIFTHHWAYRISRDQAQRLLSLDASGRIVKSTLSDPANHRVISLPETGAEPLVFFKANGYPPIQPEKEFMLYSLYRHLQIPVPETALIILTDVFEVNPDYFYAVQASEAVLGESPLKAYQDPKIIFDSEAFASQTIGAFLTNPLDGSFKNFKYSPKYQTFISIDNDLVFEPELTEIDDKKIVNVKSILYLLPQIDLPIPESVQTFFTTLDSHLIVLGWLQDLSRKNQEYSLLFAKLAFQKTRCVYQNLLPQNQIPSLSTSLQEKVQVDPEIQSDSFSPQIHVSQNLLRILVEKLQVIEKTLLNNHSVSTQALFEEVSPIVGKYYRKLKLKFSDPEEALEAVWGHEKDGINYSYVSSLLDHEELHNLTSSKNEIDESQLPETLFRMYKDLLNSGQSALDRFILRHNQRKRKKLLSLQEALKELQLLIQEGLINSQCPRDIFEFCHTLSKMTDGDLNLIKRIISLLSNLPHQEFKWLLTLEKYFLRADNSVPKDLMSSSTPISGALMKKRTFILTKSENDYLFDQKGEIRKNSFLTGRSRVAWFPEKNPEFYLKQYPEWPGYEFASTLFMRLFGIQHLPSQDLLIINNCPVLLTQKAHGDPVFRIWHQSQAFENLDPVHTGLLIISAMLINPEDGKEDNFILSQDGKYLIPIDNDHCFLPSTFQKEGSFWNLWAVNPALQTKTLLFCLDEMCMLIPLEVKHHIQSIDFDSLFLKWMTELNKLENRFNNLVDQDQLSSFFQHGTIMRIPFYKQFIQSIYWKAHKIQYILNATSEITPFDLLKAVEPFAAQSYQDSFKQGRDLQTRFTAATNNLYLKTAVDGSRLSVLNTRAMMEIINISEEDLQTDIMFQKMRPVDALELFNQLSQERIEKIQKEQDMLCELDEKNQEEKFINLFGNPLMETALKAFLANPKEGLVLRGSKLITSSKLTELFRQAPDKGVKIRFLSLPESPSLTDKEIRIFVERCPNLEYLNINGCHKLNQLITSEGEWPLLSRVEARDCLKLKKLVSYSPIKFLRIGTNSKIEIFVKKSTLDYFLVSFPKSDLFLKNQKEFELKSFYGTLSHNNFGNYILEDHFLPSLSFSAIKIGIYSILSIKDLGIFINCLDLQFSRINPKNIKRLLAWNLVNLRELSLSSSIIEEISSLELLIQGNWPKLNSLDFRCRSLNDTGLQILSQANWPLLETIDLAYTEVSKKGILNFVFKRNWPNLKEVGSCWSNFENYLFQKNWHFLTEVDFSKCKMTRNEIELIVNTCNWSQLNHLNLSDNKEIDDEGLAILCQGNWPFLETLYLTDTTVSKKGILNFVFKRNWPNLKEVHSDWKYFSNCLFKDSWSLLSVVDFSKGGMTQNEIAFIVGKCNWPQLKRLDLSDNNKIDDEALAILCQGDWPQLETLDLQSAKITQGGVEFISNSVKWPQLKYLNLSNNDIAFDRISVPVFGKCPGLEELHLENTKIISKSIEAIIDRSKWLYIKHLNVSHNQIRDEGFSVLALAEWPLLQNLNLVNTKLSPKGIQEIAKQSKWLELKYLSISSNEIFDEGLEILASGNWPLFEHLVYYNTKVTQRGHLLLLQNFKWPNFYHLEHSLTESFYNYNENPDEWSPPEIILAAVPMHSKALNDEKFQLEIVTVLDVEWLNSQEIYVSINHNDVDEKIKILPRDKLIQFESINLIFSTPSRMEPLQAIVLPASVKLLHFLDRWLYDGKKFKRLFCKKNPLLEDLCLSDSYIKTEGFEVLINRFDWMNLKKLDLSSNLIKNEGWNIIASAHWQQLEDLNLQKTGTIAGGLEILTRKSNWPHLKGLDISNNLIENEGLEALASANWEQLENLNLQKTGTTADGIKILTRRSKWPHLKKLDISNNLIRDEGLQVLASASWQQLENLNLSLTQVTTRGVQAFTSGSGYLNLKEFDISFNSIKNEGLKILSSGNWRQIQSLNLSGIKITTQGIGILISQSDWLNLKKLDISLNSIQNEGLKVLASANWKLLEDLNLQQTETTAEGIEILIDRSNWPNLMKIDLSSNLIKDEGLEILASAHWPRLAGLSLKDVQITSKGVESMVNLSNWPNLKLLDISFNQNAFDKGLETLAAGKWPLLEYLSLQGVNIKIGDIETLINKSLWSNLKELDLSRNNGLNKETILTLISEKWPDIKLIK